MINGSLIVLPIGNVPGFGVLSREHPLAQTYLEREMYERFFEIMLAEISEPKNMQSDARKTHIAILRLSRPVLVGCSITA